jgi:hypothetical protein
MGLSLMHLRPYVVIAACPPLEKRSSQLMADSADQR